MIALLVACSACLLVLCAVLLYKVRKVHLMMFQIRQDVNDSRGEFRHEAINLFQQLQQLPDLYSELELRGGLPPLRGWAASPDFLLFLARYAKSRRPQTILECGSGASTIVLGRCLQLQGSGRLISLEHDAGFAAETRRRLASLGLDQWVTVLHAPLVTCEIEGETWTWYEMSSLAEGSFDMVVVDGPPVSVGPLARYPAGPLLLPRLATGGVCLMDDMIRDDEQAIVARWVREFPRLKRSDHHCEKGCTALVVT